MAKANHTHQDDIPLAPRVQVRVGQPSVRQFVRANRMTPDDSELLSLLEEPETFSRLSVLERELVIRLGGTWETIRRTDKQTINAGPC